MITYTEKERKWILSDPGEISLRTGGKLEPSITSSMFIESPSSLELMLGRQKQPSWDCTDQKHNVLHSRNHPDKTRKRKASWSGGFEDQEKYRKSDLLKRGSESVKTIGPSSISKKLRNFHVQCEDQREVMVETLQMQRSIFTDYGRGANEFPPLKRPKISLGDVGIGNSPQFGRPTKAMTKVPKFCTSLSDLRLKKKMKNLQDNKLVEITQGDFSRNLQRLKGAPNIADLMSKDSGVEKKKMTRKGIQGNAHYIPPTRNLHGLKIVPNIADFIPKDNGVEKKTLTMKRNTHYQPGTKLTNKTNNGVVLALPRVGGCIGQDIISPDQQGKKDPQVGIGSMKWKKAETSLLTRPSEKRKRRIKIVGQHGLQHGCLAKSGVGLREKEIVSRKVNHAAKLKMDQDGLEDECFASSSTGLRKNEVVSKRLHVAEKSNRKRRQNKLMNDNVTPPKPLERLGSSKEINLQGIQIPGLVHGVIHTQSDDGHTRTRPPDGLLAWNELLHPGPQGCALPSIRADGDTATPNGVLTRDHINGLEDVHPEEDIDPVRGENVRIGVKRLLGKFRYIHKRFTGGHKDKEVFQIMVGVFPELLVNGTESIYGDVPGVEPGDRFNYRAEMDLVGLHHKPRKGIDFIPASKSHWPYGGKPVSIAACVVVAGGYVDNRDEGDVIIYTGEGGNNAIYDKGPSKDQMLTSGNEALRHSLLLHLYVRVVRKIELKPPIKPYYRYDGLYAVKDMKKERSRGQNGKPLRFGEDGEKLKSSKCNTSSSSTLVYKFLLIRKSKEEKYENVNFENLWTFKPSSCPRALNIDQEVNPFSSVNVPNSTE